MYFIYESAFFYFTRPSEHIYIIRKIQRPFGDNTAQMLYILYVVKPFFSTNFFPFHSDLDIYVYIYFFNIIVNHESHFTVKSIAGYCYYCIIFHFDVRVEVENYILYLLLQLNTIRTINVASRNRNLCNFNIGISRTEKI